MTASPTTSHPPSPTPQSLIPLALATRRAAQGLAMAATADKNRAIGAIATALEQHEAAIVAANQADCDAAQRDYLAKPLYERLKLDAVKLRGAITGLRDVAKLPDPVGAVQIHRELDAGLILTRVACPLGVLGVIFESRPDAVMQISALAVKSGNGVILKGGKEAIQSCTALVTAIKQGLEAAGFDPAAVQLLTTREETQAMLALDDYIDLVIPRGSNAFVRFVQNNTRIPVLGHADGVCHLYIDAKADLAKATAIAVDAKAAYPSACNAIETLLIHQAIAATALPPLAAVLREAGVELRGDERCRHILPDLVPATEEDWATEYSDLILAVKVVNDRQDAVTHINTYGSRHTDAIVTEDAATAAQFMAEVDAAGVYHNCSTRFADGFRYGFGAEVGISTQKMPPRGPVGLEGLVTYKYQVVGNGHVSTTYSGPKAKPFTHQDLSADV